MDGFSGYNQIKMAPEDREKTTFITMSGTFYYKVMPFSLKNAGATYQRAMVTLFHDMMHREVEVYVDDMIVKARKIEDHATNLERLFKSERGIEVDPDKVQAILLVPLVVGRPLFLYLTVNERSMGCVLRQHDETGKKERAVYYLSKKFTEYESKYSSLEKMCCALAWTAHRLRQYMLYHTTWLIAKLDLIKYIFEKPSLSGRVARWQVLLSEYDIVLCHGSSSNNREENSHFGSICFTHLPQEENQMADALATLAVMFKVGTNVKIQPIMINLRECPAHCSSVEEEIDGKSWYHDLCIISSFSSTRIKAQK
ncbi:Uncharacterized protein TCM_021512 [Theobroma cacao]|uniref:Reverse transcriptase RNase H-like domain-containing protein n=1 Tax=Theobroma cacao TaxID=3641 RepID=A0A061EQK4_THECC|nr:Uncharacterized protein TCM_021512 [Theobroma cacao]